MRMSFWSSANLSQTLFDGLGIGKPRRLQHGHRFNQNNNYVPAHFTQYLFDGLGFWGMYTAALTENTYKTSIPIL